MRSTFHTSFLKSLIFLIESTLMLLVLKKIQKKKEKSKFIYKKEEVEGPCLRTKQYFAYKYESLTNKEGGQCCTKIRGQHKKP